MKASRKTNDRDGVSNIILSFEKDIIDFVMFLHDANQNSCLCIIFIMNELR